MSAETKSVPVELIPL